MPNLPVPIGGTVVVSAELNDALGSAFDYARNQKSPATLRAYASDWRHYAAWCKTVSAEPMPRPDDPDGLRLSTNVVAGYLAHLADSGLKANTINRRAAAITFTFRAAGLTPPTAVESVKGLQRGIRRTIGTAVTRKAPATDKHVRAMIKALPGTLTGLRDRAVLAIGFATGMRRSELVALDVRHIERVPEGIRLLIERSKTDQEGAGRQVSVPRGNKLKPVLHLDAWLVAAGITVGALFRPVGKGGRVVDTRLTGRSVAEIVKHAAELADFDPTLFSGHSLRSGFVTTALQHDADHMKIMDITGHKQVQTLKIYDRRAQDFKNHAGKGFL